MRNFIYLFLAVVMSACAEKTEIKQFVFYDSHGAIYKSETAGLSVKKEFSLPGRPKLVLIATESEKIKKFHEQMQIIHSVNAEEHQYMYVVANILNEDHSGYYTTTNEAKRILGNKQFLISIYDEKGAFIISSKNVINKEKFKHHLTKDTSGR